MEKIEINKGVKVEKHSSNGKYPFQKMEVGDWFTVDVNDHGSIRTRAYQHGYKTGKKFTTAKKGDLVTVTRVE